jgi:hypothetical protein
MTASNQHHGPRVSLVKLLVFLRVVLVMWSFNFWTNVTRGLVQDQLSLNNEAVVCARPPPPERQQQR